MLDPVKAARAEPPSDRSPIVLMGIPVMAATFTWLAWMMWQDYRSSARVPTPIPIEQAAEHLNEYVRLTGAHFDCFQMYENRWVNPVGNVEEINSAIAVRSADESVSVLATYSRRIVCEELKQAVPEGELRPLSTPPASLGKLNNQAQTTMPPPVPQLELCTGCTPEASWTVFAISAGVALIFWLWTIDAVIKFRRAGR